MQSDPITRGEFNDRMDRLEALVGEGFKEANGRTRTLESGCAALTSDVKTIQDRGCKRMDELRKSGGDGKAPGWWNPERKAAAAGGGAAGLVVAATELLKMLTGK